MNLDQALAIVRAVLLVSGTLLMKHGWTNDANWADITGAVLTIVPLVWSFWHHSDTQQVAKAVAVLEKQQPATTVAQPTAQPKAIDENKPISAPANPGSGKREVQVGVVCGSTSRPYFHHR